MKRLLSILFLLTAFAVAGQAQTGCVELKEIDGSPDVKCVKTIRVTNGTLSCSGNVCTITISGGGGGSPGGADTNVQYNDSGSFGGVAGFVFDKTSKISLGVAGTSVGAVAFRNATSGTITVQPVTGALGTVTLSLPATTGTLALTSQLTAGTVTSVSFTGGLISVANATTTPTLTVAGTSGGIPYFDSGSTWATSAALAANAIVIGGGAGAAPASTTTASGILTWIGTPSSANLASALTDETGGSGLAVFNSSPTIITPSFTTGFTIDGTAVTGTIPRGNGTNFVASSFTMAAPGTSGNVLTSDGTNWTSAAPAGGGTPGGSDTQLQYNNAGSFGGISGATSDGTTVTLTSPTVNTGITLNAAPLTMSGNINAAAWTTSGIRIKGTSVTLTDTSSSGTVAAAYTNVFGGNTIAASSSTTFTNYFNTFIAPPTAGSNVTITNGWSLGLSGGQRINRDGIGTTNTTGLELANATAAAAGAQQVSPDLVFTAQGWKTTATAASQTVKFKQYVLPVQGSANPTANWVLQSEINGGGYNQVLAATYTVSNVANLYVGNGTPSSTNYSIASDHSNFTTINSPGSSQLRLSLASSIKGQLYNSGGGNAGLELASDFMYAFSSTTAGNGTADLFLRRSAAANLAFGAADAASPVAQTLSVQNVVAGTSNTAGANWTLNGSRGTGTGAGGDIIFQTAPLGGSGTSQNTLAAAFTVKGDGAVQLKSVTFTNLPTVANGYLIYCSDCTLASPCASGGSGALAKGINGAWVCN